MHISGELLQAFFSRLSIRCIEGRSEVRSHFCLHGLSGNIHPGILLQIEMASLPGRNTPKYSSSCDSQTFMTSLIINFPHAAPTGALSLQAVDWIILVRFGPKNDGPADLFSGNLEAALLLGDVFHFTSCLPSGKPPPE